MRSPTRNRFLPIRIIWILLLFPGVLSAQEFNYWGQQVGSYATLLSGAITASVRDNSAIYYNPGALGFMTNSSLSVVGNIIFLRHHNIRNGAGNDLRFENTNVDATSQIFSAIQKITDNFSITYGLLNRAHYNVQFVARHEGMYDVLSRFDGNEWYRGSYDYYKRNREDWVGFGAGWRVSPNFGIGMSIFGAAVSSDFQSDITSRVFSPDGGTQPNELVAFNRQSETFQYRNISAILVGGIAYDNGSFQAGLNITSPSMTIGFISKGMLDRSFNYVNPGDNLLDYNAGFTAERARTYRHTPIIIDLGFARVFGTRTSSNLKFSYFSRVRPYRMIEAGVPADNPIDFYPGDPVFYQISHAHKRTLNIALGFERRVHEELSIMTGFNTDFNYMPQEEITDFFQQYHSVSYLNIYAFNFGVNWFREKFNLILGLNSDFGYKFGAPQQINLRNPSEQYWLFGPIQNNTENFYFRTNFVFGFTYLFPRI